MEAGKEAQEQPPVTTEAKGSVLWITIRRPNVLNAIDQRTGAALLEAFKSVEYDDKVRALVLTGEGRAFTVGEDLNANRNQGGEGTLDLESVLRSKYNPLVQRIRKVQKPVIAAVNGVAAGAGVGLALACDLRVASDSTVFHIAFSNVGLVPDSGTAFWLVRSVGLSRATEICLVGEPLDAQKAQQLGLVNYIYPQAAFENEVDRLAARLASGPTKAFGLTKRALNKALFTDLDGMLEYEAFLQGVAGRTADHREGVKAFFEKRKPSFSGR